jgi:hypothetical protein
MAQSDRPMTARVIQAVIAGAFCVTLSASAQQPTTAQAGTHAVAVAGQTAQPDAGATSFPFSVGELAQYDVKFGGLKVGSASTLVKGIEDVRGMPALHTIFRLNGGTFFYRVNDVFESWVDRETFSSLRFYQTQQEGTSDRAKRYEIYPDRGTYVEMDKKPPREHAGVKDPLDDGSFLFFVRTLDLEVGHTYESQRYFRPERNPIRVRVLRKETIDVPAGRFRCVVVQPVIKTAGIFSENGNAEVWLSDDSRHVLVQLKSRLSFGSINLYLRSYKPGA